MSRLTIPWESEMPEGSFISLSPGYETGKYLGLFEEDEFTAPDIPDGDSMKYYFFDPTRHGYPARADYPLLIFLHGAGNSFVGKTCVNYTGAEFFASPAYQADFGGAYILVPIANEYTNDDGRTQGCWSTDHMAPLYSLISLFLSKYTRGVGRKFLLGNSRGATLTFMMGERYPEFFDALVPVGSSEIPEDSVLDRFDSLGVALFFAMGKRDEFNDFAADVVPRIPRMKAMKRSFIFTPDWVRNGDGGISSIQGGIEMGQHCLMNSMQLNLMFTDGTPMDPRLPRGFTGWIDEINRG